MRDEFAVVEVYYAASVNDTPLNAITEWLLSHRGLGLSHQKVKDAFYPLEFPHYRHRTYLNITGKYLCTPFSTSGDDRGPPHKVRAMRQECDDYKLRCVKAHGTKFPEIQVPALQERFHIEEQHLLYRYRSFDGYFPTDQWIARPKTDLTDPTEKDIYVLFSISRNYASPHDTIAVDLEAWKAGIIDAKQRHGGTLPGIVYEGQHLI